MSRMSKISVTMVYKVLAICVFKKDEFSLRPAGKGHQDGQRMGMREASEN